MAGCFFPEGYLLLDDSDYEDDLSDFGEQVQEPQEDAHDGDEKSKADGASTSRSRTSGWGLGADRLRQLFPSSDNPDPENDAFGASDYISGYLFQGSLDPGFEGNVFGDTDYTSDIELEKPSLAHNSETAAQHELTGREAQTTSSEEKRRKEDVTSADENMGKQK